MVRRAARQAGRTVAVLADLQGPKIRIGGFADGPVELVPGAPFCVDPDVADDRGSTDRVGINYPDLARDVAPGSLLLLDDGKRTMEVVEVAGRAVHCTVVTGGLLSGHKGLNLASGGLSAGALTDKDRADMLAVAEMDADFLALSFVRDAGDVLEARNILKELGWRGGIIAKIERAQAMDNLESIITASDGVLIARGDLGIEIGDTKLPAAQKEIIRRARTLNRVVITATQMMDSMITSPTPTRAEVFDVANAVLDGTDAVMLSAETAVGDYPAQAVRAMGSICLEAERQEPARKSRHRIDTRFSQVDETIALSAMYAANHTDTAAIAAYTESGGTALWMSRISSEIPIYAMSREERTQRRVCLYRGVYPVAFDPASANATEQHMAAARELVRLNAATHGDLVITTCGDTAGERGGTNSMRITRITQSS
jgi:pyruvate kinase